MQIVFVVVDEKSTIIGIYTNRVKAQKNVDMNRYTRKILEMELE